jgi:HEAT repeat protein
LGQIGDPRAVDPLVGCLKDWSWSVRRVAAEALGQLGDPRAVEPLKVAFEDGDANVRSAAADALAALGWRPKGAADASGGRATLAGQD